MDFFRMTLRWLQNITLTIGKRAQHRSIEFFEPQRCQLTVHTLPSRTTAMDMSIHLET